MTALPTTYNAKDIGEVNSILRGIVMYLRQQLNNPVAPLELVTSTTSLDAAASQAGAVVHMDCSGGALTYTLDPSLDIGWYVRLVKTDVSANALSVTGTGVTIHSSGGITASVALSGEMSTYTFIHVGGGLFDMV